MMFDNKIKFYNPKIYRVSIPLENQQSAATQVERQALNGHIETKH